MRFIKELYLCKNNSLLTKYDAMSNEIGSRGEFIFAMLLSRRDAVQKSLFKPIFLGDKQPTVDFYVDLLNYPHKKGFFFASVKATTLGYTADGTNLKF